MGESYKWSRIIFSQAYNKIKHILINFIIFKAASGLIKYLVFDPHTKQVLLFT